jgi:hypothetical protein
MHPVLLHAGPQTATEPSRRRAPLGGPIVARECAEAATNKPLDLPQHRRIVLNDKRLPDLPWLLQAIKAAFSSYERPCGAQKHVTAPVVKMPICHITGRRSKIRCMSHGNFVAVHPLGGYYEYRYGFFWRVSLKQSLPKHRCRQSATGGV